MTRWSLLVRSGEMVGRQIVVEGELIVGRAAEGPGRLASDGQISRQHARFRTLEDGRLVVEDLGSANGTRVNGERLAPETPRELNAGDSIVVGETTLVPEAAAAGDGAAEADEPATAEAPRVRPRPISVDDGPPAGAGPVDPATPREQAGSPSSIRPASPVRGAAPPAEIVWPGQRLVIPPEGVSIGREPDNDLTLDVQTVSRKHARILASEGRYFLADLDTPNGTVLNGERLRAASRWLNSGDTIELGGERLRFLTGEGTRFGGGVQTPAQEAGVVHLEGSTLSLGRDPANDVVLDDPNVSRFHAEVRRTQDGVELRDLGSRNGTRIDGQFVSQRATLRAGSQIGIGPFRLVFDGTRFVRRDDRGALRMSAEDVTMAVKGKVILNRASINIEPGEFVVIIGESGSGKTTMVKALAGVTTPVGGTVKVSGEPVLARLTDIGYVPQDEIVHRGLTVLEGLRYAAALRLPKDSTQADIDAAVERVLSELSLKQHANTRIGSLSGGQRKRVGLGTELLNRPSLLFLDEPTTGLDPGLETRLMELFANLAEEGKRAVTVVTHATKNLDLADKVCVMGQGGELSYLGPPAAAKEFFGVQTFDGIYTALETRPAPEWRREFEDEQARLLATAESQAPDQSAPHQMPRPRPNVGRQVSLLAQRYLKLLIRDQRNLALLVGQAPLIALGIALLFQTNVLQTGVAGDPNNGALLVFLVVTTAIWLGSIDGSREIIKERALMERERAVGVKLSAYLASKALVLFALVAVQCVILLVVVFGLRTLHEPASTYLVLLVVLLVTGFVSVGMGLLISSVVSSEDQAASFIPLVLIPQLLFAGAIVAVQDMGGPIKALSNLVYARWSFATSGAAVHMTDRIADKVHAAASGGLPYPDRYGPDFFSISVGGGLAILCAFLAAFFAVTYAILRSPRQS